MGLKRGQSQLPKAPTSAVFSLYWAHYYMFFNCPETCWVKGSNIGKPTQTTQHQTKEMHLCELYIPARQLTIRSKLLKQRGLGVMNLLLNETDFVGWKVLKWPREKIIWGLFTRLFHCEVRKTLDTRWFQYYEMTITRILKQKLANIVNEVIHALHT